MHSSQGAPCEGRKRALLIAVTKVKGIDVALPRAHSDAQQFRALLINQYNYAEKDIVMLLDDSKLERSFWSSGTNIVRSIKWLVKDAREHDRLVFYYSGHGGQTIRRHGSDVDGQDEGGVQLLKLTPSDTSTVIYGFNGRKIVDSTLKQRLVDPVLEAKGCHLFALFDSCHSETILDLKHNNCWPLIPSPPTPFITSSQTSGKDATRVPVPNKRLWFSRDYHIALLVSIARQIKNVVFISPWSIIGFARRTSGYFCNRIVEMLKGSFKSTSSPIHGPVQTASVRQSLSVNTAVASRSSWLVSPTRVVMSPISIVPNARCNSTCVMTEEEGNQGRVVCLSTCGDSELAHDDNEIGGTLTKFFIASLQKNSSVSYRDLLNDIQSHVTDLHAKRKRQRSSWPPGPKRQLEVMSEADYYSTERGSTGEYQITSNRPFDWNEEVFL